MIDAIIIIMAPIAVLLGVASYIKSFKNSSKTANSCSTRNCNFCSGCPLGGSFKNQSNK